MCAVKITALETENVKRIRAVSLEPSTIGLTVIGGNNNQGKTSILDSIAWALGGDRYRPSDPTRDGSTIPPRIKLTMSNGLVVERAGKNASLKVTDPNGQKCGQQLLNSFVEELALNLPKFLEQSSRDKAKTLLQIIGVGDQLHTLDIQENELYNQRHAVGRVADQKKKYALELPFYPDAPADPVSAFELIQRQQAILARNGENQRMRLARDHFEQELTMAKSAYESAQQALETARDRLAIAEDNAKIARKNAADLQDESTEEIERDLENIEAINIKVRANSDRERAEQDAEAFRLQYEDLSGKLNAVRQAKTDLLNGARMPLPGLSVADGELTYNGKKWDGMSGSDQLKVATAIVRALNPECGFALVDKLEQLDLQTLNEFGQWAEREGIQIIATRVSTGDECSILISDGQVVQKPALAPIPKWEAGRF